MKLPADFETLRVRWFVSRVDHGRRWVIQPALDDGRHRLILCELDPPRFNEQIFERTEPRQILGEAPLQGNESYTAFYQRSEAQELMDALWEAGMRPTRR